MERRPLGRSGLHLPIVGMGTWKTFDVIDPEEIAQRRQVVDVALAHGSNLFDSSPMYGAAERVLGACLEGRHDQARVATKVWTPDDSQADDQIRQSLAYFGDHVEIYQVHNLVAWPKRLATLERLRDAGKVTAVGVTHYQHSSFGEMMQIIRSGRGTIVQVPYHVQDRVVERDVLPLAAELNIGVLVMRPLGQGVLATKSPPPEALQPLAALGVPTPAQAP